MSEEFAIGIEELRDSVRQVLDEHLAATGDAIPGEDGRPVDAVLWQQMTELGWLSLCIGEDHGGLGLGAAHAAVLHEELGRALASVPMLSTLLAAEALARGGSAAQQAAWLPRLAAGEIMTAIQLPRDGAALPRLSDGRLSGRWLHLLFGDVASLLLLPVETDTGIAFVLLDSGSDGLTVERRPTVDLTRSLAEAVADDVAIGEEQVLPLDVVLADHLRNQSAAALACEAVGAAAAILARTIDYMGVRVQFGRPIGSFQALKHRAANWKVVLEAATALARHAADAIAAGEPDVSSIASSAKFYACDIGAAIAADAIQLHGGIGFTWEHVCHLFLKRAKLNQQLFGSSTEHKERVARLAFATSEPEAL